MTDEKAPDPSSAFEAKRVSALGSVEILLRRSEKLRKLMEEQNKISKALEARRAFGTLGCLKPPTERYGLKPPTERYGLKPPTAAKQIKIFVSHHHDDADALGQLKRKLAREGFVFFLAHQDIKPREIGLERMEKEIRDCDAVLYVGSREANTSAFCQQEIGMAKALDKPIVTMMTKGNPPKAFIEQIQAITYKEIDNEFIDKVRAELNVIFPSSPKINTL